MLNNIMIGRYYPVSSNIHKMNPLAKILCTVMFVAILFLYNDLFFTLLLLGFVVLIAMMSHIPLKTYLKAILSLKILIIGIVIINLIFNVPILTTVYTISRLILVVMYTSILTLTTPPTELTFGLEQFFSPLKYIKIPIKRMALTLTLAIRFIPTIIDQASRIMKSQICRGVNYNGFNIKERLVGLRTLVLPMFIYSFKRAEDLSISMELRNYVIDNDRTNFRMNPWRFFDTYMFLIHFIILAALIYKGFML